MPTVKWSPWSSLARSGMRRREHESAHGNMTMGHAASRGMPCRSSASASSRASASRPLWIIASVTAPARQPELDPPAGEMRDLLDKLFRAALGIADMEEMRPEEH